MFFLSSSMKRTFCCFSLPVFWAHILHCRRMCST
jgi:hypothetical protein